MNNRVFFISDTHFGHKKIIQFEQDYRNFSTIEEHDDELVYRWNNTVKKHDTVWHLGDVLFGEKSFDTLQRINGIKRLVMGNHDQYHIAKYSKYFSSIHGCAEYKGYILSHIPVHKDQSLRFKANIHGHLHHKFIDDEWYINVSAERIGLKPILFDELIKNSIDK